MSTITNFTSKLSQFELQAVKSLLEYPQIVNEETKRALRWSLSLGRITKIKGQNETILPDPILKDFRKELSLLISDNHSALNLAKSQENASLLLNLLKKTYQKLFVHLPKLSKTALDNAINKRPLALTLSGGGGTGYVFCGALDLLSKHRITPDVISGTSMGAIIGAYRALKKDFSLEEFQQMIVSSSWSEVAKPHSTPSRFGIPATFRLCFHETLGKKLNPNKKPLRLKDLYIPLKVCVAGISKGQKSPENLEEYAHLLDNTSPSPQSINQKTAAVLSQILSFAQQPLKPLYLGLTKLTKEFDVIDAIGFSSAIPGVFHYDIFRHDPRMITLLEKIFAQENLFRLIDGGFIDNLPVFAAKKAVENGETWGYDPFLLSLDSFSPWINTNIIFYPMMRFAAEHSREGHLLSHLSIRFKKSLSPINFVPNQEAFSAAVNYGQEGITNYLPLIKEMLTCPPQPVF